MDNSIWLALLPLFVLITSSWLLICTDKKYLLKQNIPLSIFLSGIIGLNLIEFLTYIRAVNPNVAFMKMYCVFMISILASILVLTIKISKIKFFTTQVKHFTHFISITSFFYVFMILFTDLIISGISITPYSVTRVPGELYFLLRYIFVGFSIPIIALLITSSLWKNVDRNVIRSRLLLLSFSPLLISLLIIFAMMENGAQINASLVLPIGSAFLFLVMIHTERSQDLFKLLIKIPYTNENLSYKKIIREIQEFLTSTSSGDQASLKSLTATLEQHIINMAVEASNGSQVKAAALLKTSTSSICRKKRT